MGLRFLCGMVRVTRQKKVLSLVLDSFDSFFDAAQFYNAVVAKKGVVGLATVYRYLASLESSCSVHSFVCDGRKIYSKDLRNHAHFTCEKCARVEHLHIKTVDFLRLNHGGKVCHFQLELVGVCEKCSKK